MKYTYSLKKSHEFRRMYSKGKSAAGSVLVIYCRRSKPGKNRLGITVGSKLGGAVVRNKVKRRIREAYRINEDKFKTGWDIVIVARVRAGSAPFSQIESSVINLSRQLGLLKGGLS